MTDIDNLVTWLERQLDVLEARAGGDACQVAADRRVLAEYERLRLRDPLRFGPYWDGQRDAWEMAVRMRAEAYDGQPGYQERWRRP